MATMEVQYTNHALQRMTLRSLSVGQIEIVLTYGETYHRAGAEFYHLRRCDIPMDEPQAKEWIRLVGTTVVMAKDHQKVLTAYRNERSGLQKIKHKQVYGQNSFRFSQSSSRQL
jgi:hypothetical protein